MNTDPGPRYILKLFITGRSTRSEAAIEMLQRICDYDLAGQFELVIVDVLEHPEEAEEGRILATPTVVKELPPPIRKVIGDLSDREKVLIGLDIRRQDES
jgi:circadian clock protein KaiB